MRRTEFVTLDALPPGMIFTTRDGIIAIKSEYHQNGRPMCILVESGEFFSSVTEETEVMALEIAMPRRTVKWHFFFAFYDAWIGFYWDRKQRTLYWCPLPFCVFSFHFGGEND